LFHQPAEVSQASAIPCSMAAFSSGNLAGVEGLSSADADLGETRHEFRLGRVRRAELQNEVEDVEELQRGLLICRRERLNEINDRCGFWCGCAQEF